MNKTLLTTIVFLSSMSFFTGCADNNPKPNKKLAKESISVYNIMGIKEPTEERPLFVVKEDRRDNYNFITTNSNYQNIPMAQTFPVEHHTIPIAQTFPVEHHTIPIAQTFPVERHTIPIAQTFPIEHHTIPIAKTIPVYQNVQNYPRNNFASNDIEVVSYGSYNNNNNNYHRTSNIINHIGRSSIIRKIESDAKSFLGTRYVWGATGPSKFDCSGFTQWVYRDAGINIPRVSRDQAKVGQYVSFNNLRKGDMVFFDTNKHKKGKVTHVGIYLGNGYFIHASSAAKKVVVFNWNEKPYYKKRFLWGRRVIHNNAMYALK